MHRLWDIIVRWRTWIVNVIGALLVSPDLYFALAGYDWSLIIPPRYMPYITLAIVVINIWMRPRPAVRARDPEARR